MHTITHLDEVIVIDIDFNAEENVCYDLAAVNGHLTRNITANILINANFVYLEWISSNSICNFLSFIEDLLSQANNITINVYLFDNKLLDEIKALGELNKKHKQHAAFIKKLRFYHRWDFAQQIYRIHDFYKTEQHSNNSIVCYPTKNTFDKLTNQFSEDVYYDKSKYSSTLMPISALDVDESSGVNKISTDKRIKNVAVILWNHIDNKYLNHQLFNYEHAENKDLDKINQIKYLSTLIMYELIKNIYQHSNTICKSSILGFTAVQINKHSILNSSGNNFYPTLPESKVQSKVNLYTLLSNSSSYSTEYSNEKVRYISISICDSGIGIPNSVRKSFKDLNAADSQGDLNLIKKAIFTPFTVKQKYGSNEEPEFYFSRKEKFRLSKRGYGWISTAIMISSQLGALNITSGRTSITYRTSIEGYGRIIQLLENESSTIDHAKELFKNPELIFEEARKEIPEVFQVSGTRILIEIPIVYNYKKY